MSYEIFPELDASFVINNKTWRDDGYACWYYVALALSQKRGLQPESGKWEIERDLFIPKKALKTEDDPTWFEIHRTKQW